MECLGIRIGGRSTFGESMIFCFVDDEDIRHLDDAPFHPLNVVTSSANEHQDKNVDHVPYGRLALAYAHRFHQNKVVAGSFYQLDGL